MEGTSWATPPSGRLQKNLAFLPIILDQSDKYEK